jgi:hypothetical protein
MSLTHDYVCPQQLVLSEQREGGHRLVGQNQPEIERVTILQPAVDACGAKTIRQNGSFSHGYLGV